MPQETFTSHPQYGGLLHPEFIAGVIENTMRESVVLSNFTRMRNMIARETWLDVRSELPSAFAVDGYNEGGAVPSVKTNTKKVTTQKFEPRLLKAGEFAAIKVFRDADLADALANGYDVIGGDIPVFASQFGRAIDRAIIFGVDKPVEWADIDSLWLRASTNGLVVTPTANNYVDLFGVGGVMEKIELTDYAPTGLVSAVQMRARLQGMVDGDGRPIFAPNATLQEGTPFALGGFPLWFVRNGSWDYTKASMLMADFTRLVYSIREEITYRTTRDGIIVDGAGKSHNLAQENKTALILHMRLGWQVLDPVTQMSNNPVPFAFLGVAAPTTP